MTIQSFFESEESCPAFTISEWTDPKLGFRTLGSRETSRSVIRRPLFVSFASDQRSTPFPSVEVVLATDVSIARAVHHSRENLAGNYQFPECSCNTSNKEVET